MAGAEKITCF